MMLWLAVLLLLIGVLFSVAAYFIAKEFLPKAFLYDFNPRLILNEAPPKLVYRWLRVSRIMLLAGGFLITYSSLTLFRALIRLLTDS